MVRPVARPAPAVTVTCPAGLLEALEQMQRGEGGAAPPPAPKAKQRSAVWIGARRVRHLASELAELEVEEELQHTEAEPLEDEEALRTLADLADSEPLGQALG